MEVDAETPVVVVAAAEKVTDVKMTSPEKAEPTDTASPAKVGSCYQWEIDLVSFS